MIPRHKASAAPNIAAKDPLIAMDYGEAVTEAKAIIAKMDSGWLRLGELAHGVTTAYGDERLKRFASDIGIAACTLARKRSVFRRWQTEGAISAPAPISYAIAQELQTHPNRHALIAENPKMTKMQARKHMRALRKEARADADPAREEASRWFRDVAKHAGEALSDAGILDGEFTPELEKAMRESIEPTLLPTLRKAGEAYLLLADYLKQLVAEEQLPEFAQAAA